MTRVYTCAVYTTGSRRYPIPAAPEQFWRRIELAYRTGARTLLVYESEPEDPGELPDLMLRLQTRAATSGYTIIVTGGDGTTRTAPPIRTA